MGCNCKMTVSILAILVIVFAFWETTYSKWVIVIAAALLLIHAMKCGKCSSCGMPMSKGVAKSAGKSKSKKKR
jgi:hypothetical protein